MHRLTVISLGSGGEECLTRQCEAALRKASCLILRTARHPIFLFLEQEDIPRETMDELYESCEDFDTLNRSIAARLRERLEKEEVCYAVTDAAGDSALEELLSQAGEGLRVEFLSGVSHRERCLNAVGATGRDVRFCTGTLFPETRLNPEQDLLLTEIFSRETAGDCKLRLMELFPEETPVRLITGKEETGELKVRTIPLYELDRQKAFDHLTAVYVKGLSFRERDRRDMEDLNAVVRILRSPEGCPWDREQTHESILTNLLEESWEFIQAVKAGDTEHMYDELGDVLLQIALQSEIGRQCGEFDWIDVTSAISEKMIARHTHVFGDTAAATPGQVLTNWEAFKRKERGLATTAQAMRDVSTGLSTLLRAKKVLNKAQNAGLSLTPEELCQELKQGLDQISEKLEKNFPLEKEWKIFLLNTAFLSKLVSIDGDMAIFDQTEAFIRAFDHLEKEYKNAGKSLEGLTFREISVYCNKDTVEGES